MHKIALSIDELIGSTPMLRLCSIEKELGLCARLYAKLEFFNPGGSIKDRVALNLINEAEKEGSLTPGGTIIEPTSGNTGIGLALVGVRRGYKVIIVMPDSASRERIEIIKGLGAKVVLTEESKGMIGAIEKAKELKSSIQKSFIPDQFSNTANPNAHVTTTAEEISSALDGKVDILVSGVGTGGTLTGIAQVLKKKSKNTRIVAVEPQLSPIISAKLGYADISQAKSPIPHKIQGIGAGFIPKVLNTELIDEVIIVSDEDAIKYARLLACSQGVLAGISSGAALAGAIGIAKREENTHKNIVIILPDGAERYLSQGIYD